VANGGHEVELTRLARKDLDALQGKNEAAHAEAVVALGALERDPFAGHPLSGSLKGCRSLEFSVKGSGQYRAVYVVLDNRRVSIVFIVATHENVYREASKRLSAFGGCSATPNPDFGSSGGVALRLGQAVKSGTDRHATAAAHVPRHDRGTAGKLAGGAKPPRAEESVRMRTFLGVVAASVALAAPAGSLAQSAPATPAATPVPAERTARELATESRPVAGFDEVELRGIGTLVVAEGDAESLEIEAEPRVLRKISTEVEGGRLVIAPERSFRARQPIEYRLTVDDLSAIELAGAARAEGSGVTAERLSVVAGGASEVFLDGLSAAVLYVAVAGTGTVEVAGEADRQVVETEGTGTYIAGDLASREAAVTAGGASEATVRVSDVLAVEIGGASRVAYLGDPRVSEQDISGVGELVKVG
jgi:mRNA-degrading endonuclease RelE of RelBE toxin-antitoxin system